MKLDLSSKIKSIDGEDFSETFALVLSKILMSSNKGDAIKLYDWAMNLHKDGSIEIDNSDKNILTKFIETTESISILIKGQLLKILGELK